MKVRKGAWVMVTQRAEDGLDRNQGHKEDHYDTPKYLYEIGSGGRVLMTDSEDALVEFHWGRYNYQQGWYREQPKDRGIYNAKGGWYVSKNCLTVLDKNLTIKQMRALGKVMK